MTISKIPSETAKAVLDAFKGELRERDQRTLGWAKGELNKLARTPDRSTAERVFGDTPTPYGTGGRATPAWERAYAAQNWSAETRLVRTPANDMETVEFIRAIVTNDQAKLREIGDRAHNRDFHARADLAIGAGGTGTGGGLVPEGFATAVQIIMARAARLRRLCNIVPGGEFARKIPVQTTKSVAEVHAEAADMNIAVDPIYGSVTPEPVKIGGLVKFSRELLDDSPLALVSLVTTDLGEAIGTLEDLSILDGGTLTDSLLTDVATGAATWTDATETLATLTTKYYELPGVSRGRATWLINESAAAVLTAISATDGRPMLTEFGPPPNAIDDVPGQTGTLLGRPVLVFPTGATGITADEGIFADLSGYSIYDRENFRAESSRESDFDTDQVALRVSRRLDGIISQASRMLRFA